MWDKCVYKVNHFEMKLLFKQNKKTMIYAPISRQISHEIVKLLLRWLVWRGMEAFR